MKKEMIKSAFKKLIFKKKICLLCNKYQSSFIRLSQKQEAQKNKNREKKNIVKNQFRSKMLNVIIPSHKSVEKSALEVFKVISRYLINSISSLLLRHIRNC